MDAESVARREQIVIAAARLFLIRRLRIPSYLRSSTGPYRT